MNEFWVGFLISLVASSLSFLYDFLNEDRFCQSILKYVTWLPVTVVTAFFGGMAGKYLFDESYNYGPAVALNFGVCVIVVLSSIGLERKKFGLSGIWNDGAIRKTGLISILVFFVSLVVGIVPLLLLNLKFELALHKIWIYLMIGLVFTTGLYGVVWFRAFNIECKQISLKIDLLLHLLVARSAIGLRDINELLREDLVDLQYLESGLEKRKITLTNLCSLATLEKPIHNSSFIPKKCFIRIFDKSRSELLEKIHELTFLFNLLKGDKVLVEEAIIVLMRVYDREFLLSFANRRKELMDCSYGVVLLMKLTPDLTYEYSH